MYDVLAVCRLFVNRPCRADSASEAMAGHIRAAKVSGDTISQAYLVCAFFFCRIARSSRFWQCLPAIFLSGMVLFLLHVTPSSQLWVSGLENSLSSLQNFSYCMSHVAPLLLGVHSSPEERLEPFR